MSYIPIAVNGLTLALDKYTKQAKTSKNTSREFQLLVRVSIFAIQRGVHHMHRKPVHTSYSAQLSMTTNLTYMYIDHLRC